MNSGSFNLRIISKIEMSVVQWDFESLGFLRFRVHDISSEHERKRSMEYFPMHLIDGCFNLMSDSAKGFSDQSSLKLLHFLFLVVLRDFPFESGHLNFNLITLILPNRLYSIHLFKP